MIAVVGESVIATVGGSVTAIVGESVIATVGGSVSAIVGGSVIATVGASVPESSIAIGGSVIMSVAETVTQATPHETGHQLLIGYVIPPKETDTSQYSLISTIANVPRRLQSTSIP